MSTHPQMSGEVNQAKIEGGKISSLLCFLGLNLSAPKNYRWLSDNDLKRSCLFYIQGPDSMLLSSSLDVLVEGIAIHRSFTRGGSALRSKAWSPRSCSERVKGLAEKMIKKHRNNGPQRQNNKASCRKDPMALEVLENPYTPFFIFYFTIFDRKGNPSMYPYTHLK